MIKEEYEEWKAIAEVKAHPWIENVKRRHNNQGAFFYKGDEEGVYIMATLNGSLELGAYNRAYPSIDFAYLRRIARHQLSSFHESFMALCELGGRQLVMDMYSQLRDFDILESEAEFGQEMEM